MSSNYIITYWIENLLGDYPKDKKTILAKLAEWTAGLDNDHEELTKASVALLYMMTSPAFYWGDCRGSEDVMNSCMDEWKKLKTTQHPYVKNVAVYGIRPSTTPGHITFGYIGTPLSDNDGTPRSAWLRTTYDIHLQKFKVYTSRAGRFRWLGFDELVANLLHKTKAKQIFPLRFKSTLSPDTIRILEKALEQYAKHKPVGYESSYSLDERGGENDSTRVNECVSCFNSSQKVLYTIEGYAYLGVFCSQTCAHQRWIEEKTQ